MNDRNIANKLNQGDGAYRFTKTDAGQTYKAARRYKIPGDISVWRRTPRKAGK